LIQTARDKAVEILKSFNEKKKEKPKLRRISIRFDRRCYSFAKTTNKLTPYWLTLSLNRRTRISLPIKFGKKQQKFIEEALQGKWQFCTVEMVKRNGEWYAHFVLKKEVEFHEPETVVGVDSGEWNIATAIAISKQNSKPMKGQFWSGTRIREIRGKYAHIRRNLQRKKRLDLVIVTPNSTEGCIPGAFESYSNTSNTKQTWKVYLLCISIPRTLLQNAIDAGIFFFYFVIL